MGVDRAGAGADDPHEAAEEPPPPDRRPPLDRPGSEGAPSRADSRNGAAAANDARDQAAENQGEEKPDTAQESQETSEREGNTTVDNEPETPGTSESNEGLSNDDGSAELYDNNPTQEDPGGRPEPSAEIGDPKDADQREQPPDGRNAPHDSTTPPETDKQPVSADAERDADQASDGPREQGGVVEADEYADATLTESMETPGQRLERRDETKSEIESEPNAEGTGIVSKQDVGDRLMVRGTPLHEYLDPVGAAAWSNETGDVMNERSGDRIVDGESDKDSRFEKLRKKGFEKGDDALETASKATNRAHDLLTRQPPAGHVETRSGPDVTLAPHQGIDAGDALAAAMMAGVLFNDAIRRIHGKAIRRRGLDDADNR